METLRLVGDAMGNCDQKRVPFQSQPSQTSIACPYECRGGRSGPTPPRHVKITHRESVRATRPVYYHLRRRHRGPDPRYPPEERGWNPLVIEPRALRTDGYMMDFFGDGSDVGERMGITDALRAIRYPIDYLRYVDERGHPFLPSLSIGSAALEAAMSISCGPTSNESSSTV